MKIIDLPIFYELSKYQESISSKVELISKIEGVKTIYQVGSITTPGVSDIDMVVIFEDNFNLNYNVNQKNDLVEKYFFSHSLLGAGESIFEKSKMYSFFHNYKLLHGKNIDLTNNLEYKIQKILKKQIALEYLIKMYITLYLQKSYNTIKLRSTFLHLKAILYDYEFLSYRSDNIINLVEEGMHYRETWFDNNFAEQIIIDWFNRFFTAFEDSLSNILNENVLYLTKKSFNISKNIKVKKGKKILKTRIGLLVNSLPMPISQKRKFNLNNKFNYFNFTFPFSNEPYGPLINYFEYCNIAKTYNKKYLPFFLPLVSSLNK